MVYQAGTVKCLLLEVGLPSRLTSGFPLSQVANFLNMMAKEINVAISPVPHNQEKLHGRPLANGCANSGALDTFPSSDFDPLRRRLFVKVD
jgi:hypothetical protein